MKLTLCCTCQLRKLQNAQFDKDGQIKMLRDKHSQLQAELNVHKQRALKTIEQQTEEKTRKEAEMERDLERLRSELKFKEHEITELRGMFAALRLVNLIHLHSALSRYSC